MFTWLDERCLAFQLSRNGHVEDQISVSRYLVHRERVGDTLIFADEAARGTCMDADELCELTVRTREQTVLHFVATTVSNCLELARSKLEPQGLRAVAA